MWWCWQLSDVGFTSSLVSLSVYLSVFWAVSTYLYFGLRLPVCISGCVYLSVFQAVFTSLYFLTVYLSVFRAGFTWLYFGLCLPICILGCTYLSVFQAVFTCLYFGLSGWLSVTLFERERENLFLSFLCFLGHVFSFVLIALLPFCRFLSSTFLFLSSFAVAHFCVWYCFRPHFTLS